MIIIIFMIAADKHTSEDMVGVKAKLFRGLADTSRLAILLALRARPLSVSQLVATTGLTQSNVSNHLACLRGCNLVVTERQGRYVVYRLSDDRVAEFLDLADDLLANVALGVKQCPHQSSSTELE